VMSAGKDGTVGKIREHNRKCYGYDRCNVVVVVVKLRTQRKDNFEAGRSTRIFVR
jgi:hypothetical protein